MNRKVWLRRTGIAGLIPLVGIVLLSLLLYMPALQNLLFREAFRRFGKASGMDIKAGKIRLSFPLDFSCDELMASGAQGDTLFSLQHLRIHLAPLPLFKQNLSIDTLHLENLRIATGSFIDGMELKGEIGHFAARALIRLSAEQARVHSLTLSDADISLRLDSVSQDETASSPLRWIIDVEQAGLSHIGLKMQIPADTLALSAGIGRAGLKEVRVDTGASRYTAGQLSLTDSRIEYEGKGPSPAGGFDPRHIALNRLHASIDSIVYQGEELNVHIRAFSATERSGLEILALEGSLGSDSLQIEIPGLEVRTPGSVASLKASVPRSALEEQAEGEMRLLFTASIGKSDLFTLLGQRLPGAVGKAYPEAPLSLVAEVEGNLASLRLRELKAGLPGAFSFRAGGTAAHPADSLRRAAHIHWQAQTQQAGFALNFLGAEQRDAFRIPEDMSLLGDIDLEDQEYKASLLLTEGRAKLGLRASYHTLWESYEATLDIDSLEPVHFMPSDSLKWLSASLRLEGKGTELFADSTQGVWTGQVSRICYGPSEIADAGFSASLKDHQLSFSLKSKDPAARMELAFDGSLYREELKGMLTGNIDSLDLPGLHLSDKPLGTSFQVFAEVASDLQKKYLADLTLGNWALGISGLDVRQKTLTLHALSDADTTSLSFHAGDLGLVFSSGMDATDISKSLSGISGEISRQLKEDSTLHTRALRSLFPEMSLHLRAGRDNPVYSLLRQQYDTDFGAFSLQASAAPEEGLRIDAALYALSRDTFRIDTLRASVFPDTAGWAYKAEVIKNKYRQQQPFRAGVQGNLGDGYAEAEFRYLNGKEETGLHLGLRASREAGSLKLHLYPEQPVIAFNTFTLNPDNFIRFRSPKEIEANVHFSGEEHSSLRLHSQTEEGKLPELHVELNRIDMDVVSKGFAGMPHIGGIMSAGLRYAPSENSFLVAADTHIDELVYEGGEVGELMLNAVYLPLEGDSHQVDAHLYRKSEEIASATAIYEAKRNAVAGSLAVDTLPLSMLSPFIPERMASLNGALNGWIEIGGALAAPVVNGHLQVDTGSVYTGITASRFHLDNKPLEIKNNRLSFDDFKVYAAGKNPLLIRGELDFRDFSRLRADLRLEGHGLQLLDVEQNTESLVYGKLLAGLDATLKGPLDALNVRGDLHLLGGTQVTYVMKESPLSVEDRLKDLVSFTSFADTSLHMRRQERKPPLPLGGMDLLMQIHIDPIVQLRADLTADQSGYVALEGGGELSFQYTQQGEMLLNGRYTLSDGRLRYALPLIPLKEFRIKANSHIQWDGNPMNPSLSLAATQPMRTSVSLMGEAPRMVNFEVGIDLRQRVENMSLLFTLDAPEDMAVQEELNKMGVEGRSTQAVGMMVTGLYLANGNSGKVNLNMGNALNSFLRNEINNIAGDALKTVDISFGMDTYEPDSEKGGQQRTDYSFRFAKRFYNDRLRIVIGGKVSAGDVQQKESFIDNASIEWRLNQAGTGYLKVFHDKNYKSLLDGEVTETGLGIVLRRKMLRLRELFNPFEKSAGQTH